MINKLNKQFLNVASEGCWLTQGLDTTYSDSDVCITDTRVAQLLLVLSELDESVAGLDELSESELSDLVCSAILACGFVNPVEARCAIASVLQAIEAPHRMLMT